MSIVETVGQTAGLVWRYLGAHPASSLAAVERGVEAPRAVVYMALGWLAREGKIVMVQENRSTLVSLASD